MSQQISKKFTEKVPANYIILLPFIFLFLLGCQDQNSSSSLTIQEKNLGENLVYLMDSEKSLTFNNILSQDKSGLFQKSDKLINLGLTRSAVWFRFFLPPTDDKSMKYFIEADNPTVDKVSLYAPTADGKYKSIHSGESVPMSKRPLSHHHILFPVTQQYDTTKAYYMRVESQSHIVMTIKLWSEKSFLKNDQNEQYVSGLAYGILLAMILYNLFIYISLMDKSYLFYVFFICNFLLFLMTLDGTAFHYLWPDWPYWSMRSGIFFSAFSQFVGIIFVRDFVNSKQYLPLVDKILLVIIAFNGLNSVLTFILPVYEMNIIGLIPSVIGPLMTVVASVLSWKRGYHPAIYFVIAFLALLVAGILYLITILGVMDSVFFKNHSMQFGSVLAVILFSLALADRINVMKHETDRLKDEFLANTSHELKTPLSGMIGLIDSLIAGSVGKLTEIQKAQLGLLSASGRRLSILINDILDFTRAKFQDLPLILEPVSLKAITDDVISISTGLIGIKPVSISNNVPDNLPAVEADRNRLEQILYNLVGNAIKFTDSGMVT
ncbi:MAG: sensor histidine kinase, partial [Spirochaetota bacterium]|nr:sensor histidine kinase [Spirochaetota bacterium]